ncbi:MAG: cell division protein ZapA [Deltaproteobacteria bacterium]|nr:cell division protein ZapA [Deltaproteobacteria bacterium]
MARAVKVTLMGTDFRLQTEEPEEFVVRVAQLVDSRIAELRGRAANLPAQHLALLTALTLAEDLEKERLALAQLRQRWADRLEVLAARAATR